MTRWPDGNVDLILRQELGAAAGELIDRIHLLESVRDDLCENLKRCMQHVGDGYGTLLVDCYAALKRAEGT